jgi:UDP-N-acetylglucosamine 2-epimerase
MRENTERPVTVIQGTNTLVGKDKQKIARSVSNISKGNFKRGTVPALWDGRASQRIAAILRTKVGVDSNHPEAAININQKDQCPRGWI